MAGKDKGSGKTVKCSLPRCETKISQAGYCTVGHAREHLGGR